MSDIFFLFTLHESEEDFRIKGSVLARSPQEAASVFGGEFIEMEGYPLGSATLKTKHELEIYGKIYFAHELFRNLSNKEFEKIALDYNPGMFYEKYPGFVIWAKPNEEGRTFILRRNYILTPEYSVY